MHAATMAEDLPDPDTLMTDQELLASEVAAKHFTPAQVSRLKVSSGEIGPTESRRIFTGTSKNPPHLKRQAFWVRAKGKIQGPWHAHAMAIAYFSDSWFLSTALIVNNKSFTDVSMMASLDHSIYFHRPCQADEWLYFEMESPWSGANRGLVLGRVFTRSGELVAECIQEGLIRMRETKANL